MPEKHLFEYAVIRVVPEVEREEFMNAGVILFCPSLKFLKTLYHLNEEKLKHFSPGLDLKELDLRLQVFQRICAGQPEGGTIGRLPLPSRFRWLTSTRSTVIQTSMVHPGLCDDPEKTLQQLLTCLVL